MTTKGLKKVTSEPRLEGGTCMSHPAICRESITDGVGSGGGPKTPQVCSSVLKLSEAEIEMKLEPGQKD